ncbi:MAG: hypothetical protein ACK57R_15930, partial [Dolichospermum sp.]
SVGILIPLYVILWVIIPEARTTAEKLEMHGEPIDINNISKTVKEEKIKISKKIDLAVESFKRVISQNHGVKEDHILSLLLPIGIDSDDLDPAWLADMNTFGEKRGLVAHTSATSYMTIQTPDPANELNTVTQITHELLRIDELINNLIE